MTSIAALQNAVESWVQHGGVAGLVLAMTVENLVQVVPSLAILPLAGYLVASGTLTLPAAITGCTAGSLLGCMLWFWLGRTINERALERLTRSHGRWLGLTPARLRRSRRWFRRHDQAIVCWGRLVPVLRTNVSLPAGIERMPWKRFALWSWIGSMLWNSLWIAFGMRLAQPILP